MNFRPRAKDEPEINLIPFIDVLLVILIFLMLTTTYSKFLEPQLTLPVADAEQRRDHPEVIVSVAADRPLRRQQDRRGRQERGCHRAGAAPPPPLAATAWSSSRRRHVAAPKSVVTVMEAARRVGLTQVRLPRSVVGVGPRGQPLTGMAFGAAAAPDPARRPSRPPRPPLPRPNSGCKTSGNPEVSGVGSGPSLSCMAPWWPCAAGCTAEAGFGQNTRAALSSWWAM